MRILYIFPHPDDESFGPAPVMKIQREQGHEVFLLTLTRGGGTKVRQKLGLTVAEMGEVRYREMLKVEKLLQLSGMLVLDCVFLQLREEGASFLKRLAFLTIPNKTVEPIQNGKFLIKQSEPGLID